MKFGRRDEMTRGGYLGMRRKLKLDLKSRTSPQVGPVNVGLMEDKEKFISPGAHSVFFYSGATNCFWSIPGGHS